MCCRKFLFIAILSLLCSTVFAQDEEWFSGAVYLQNDQVLKGQVAVKPEYDVVLFKIGQGEEITVLPAHKVVLVHLRDPLTKSMRKFVALHIGENARSYYQLYELVIDGPVSVFRRQNTMWYSLHVDITEYDYYILHEDELYGYTRFKRKVYPDMMAAQASVSKYVKKNNLNLGRLDDILRVVEFYNEEVVASSPVASTAAER